MSLSEIRAEYERIRAQEREALFRRIEEAAALHPDFLSIAIRRREAALSVGSAVRMGHSAELAAQTAQVALAAIDEEEHALLRVIGLPEDYLTLRFQCELCRDTGYIGGRKTYALHLHAKASARSCEGDFTSR